MGLFLIYAETAFVSTCPLRLTGVAVKNYCRKQKTTETVIFHFRRWSVLLSRADEFDPVADLGVDLIDRHIGEVKPHEFGVLAKDLGRA